MKVGLSSLLFPKNSLEEIVEMTSMFEFEHIEIICDVPHFRPEFKPGELLGLKELINSYNLSVSIHAPFWDLNPASHYPGIKKLTTKQVKKSIDICSFLGGCVVTTHPGRCPIPELEPTLAMTKTLFQDFVSECLPRARDRGVTLAVENMSDITQPYWAMEEFIPLIEEFEQLKITFDVGHAYIAHRRRGAREPEREIAKMMRKIKDHLACIHLHDNRGLRDDHLLPGEGEIKFERIFKAMKENKFNGPLVIELWSPEDPLAVGRKALSSIEKFI
jgi:sugar phosphate isomerase/epimerase